MRRRTLLTGLAAATAAPTLPALAQGRAATTLSFIPNGDVTSLDPMSTTSYGVRNHGHMCWDTLYGPDVNFAMQPQLGEGHTVENDGLRWVFTLRENIRFHDNERIRAADAVASIQRWWARDTLGQTLRDRTEEIRALDDRRFEIRLKQRFGPMLEALGKPSSYPCFVYPERFATVDPARPFTEVVGSGPYRLVPEERLAGARTVYRRVWGGESPQPPPAAPALRVLGGGGPEDMMHARRSKGGVPIPASLDTLIRGICERSAAPYLLRPNG